MALLPRELSPAAGGASLLHALNAAGLRVGVTEVARLHRVFAHEPRVEGPVQLASLLRAALARTDEEREAVERVCAAWLGETEAALQRGPARDVAAIVGFDARTEPTSLAPGRGRSRAWRTGLGQRAVAAVRKLAARVRALALWEHLADALPGWARSRRFGAWVAATVVVLSLALLGITHGTSSVLSALGVSAQRFAPLPLVSFSAALLIGLALRLRRTIAKPGRAARGAQAPREFLPAVRAKGPVLLDAREQEALVWGIEHFVSEEATPHLDLPATVRETAREGGIPQPRYKLARTPREVWLWVDESSQGSAAARLAGEIEASLRAHGLPVERAAFWGIPDQLFPPAGRPFGPNEGDERRDGAFVAVLTDGRLLRLQHAIDSRRVVIDALLRDLGRWPRLAFVDFSSDEGLRSVLLPRELDVIAPRQLAGYLGASEATRLAVRPPRRTQTHRRQRDVDTWAAACCLAPAGSVDEDTALALARAMGISAWALPLLRAAAPGPPGRLAWPHAERARRLDSFTHTVIHPPRTVAEPSRLHDALRFWEQRYDEELQRRQEAATPAVIEAPRTDETGAAPTVLRLRLEREVLRLWRDPHSAARALHAHYGDALRDPIREHLERLTSADGEREGCVRLPWPWADIDAAEQAMLQEMGFAGGRTSVRLRAAGRIWLALGVSLTVAATAALDRSWAIAGVAVLCALCVSRPWQRRAWARLRALLQAPAVPPPVAAPPLLEAVPPLPPGIASLSTYRFTVVTVDTRGAVRERREGEAQHFAEDLGAGVMLEMTLVPGGTFVMGSPADEADRRDGEGPQHNVTLGPFFLGRYPVMQAQWRAVARLRKVERDLNADPSGFKGDDRPVEQVTWHDAVEFCRRLARHTGRDYRLPSEAQWEYACRAGTTTPFHFGPTITPDLVNYDGNYPYGAAPKGQYRERTTPVGGFGLANAFGLADMHGNVLEWCQDIVHESYNGAPVDGSAWESGGDATRRVLRGGAWIGNAWSCRSAVRGGDSPERRYVGFGVRVVCAVSRTQ